LTKAGANFVVSQVKEDNSKPEGWGTEATQELAAWMQQVLAACHKLGHDLQAGPLEHLEGAGLDHRIVVLPQDEKAFMVGWPADAKSPLSEQSKQLIASWDS
jgi:hypothetical protein